MANRLREIRQASEVSQSELADAIDMSPSMISKLESGERDLTAQTMKKISMVLGCHPGELLEPLPALPMEDQEDLELLRALTPEERRAIQITAKAMSAKGREPEVAGAPGETAARRSEAG